MSDVHAPHAANGIRLATRNDRNALWHLVNDAFRPESAIKKGNADRLIEGSTELDDLLERGTFLIKDDAGTAIACAYVEPQNSRCYLGLLSVAATEQGNGLGRQMVTAAENFARQHGCTHMYLRLVSQRREALQPLYERLGYTVTGTQDYPAALADLMVTPGHFIIMEKPL